MSLICFSDFHTSTQVNFLCRFNSPLMKHHKNGVSLHVLHINQDHSGCIIYMYMLNNSLDFFSKPLEVDL